MCIAHAGTEQEIEDPRKDRIADVAMMPWHCARLDLAAQPVAHDDFVAGLPFLDETRQLLEIVAVVGVAHDDERSARFLDALAQSVAVAFERGVNDARPVRSGDVDRAVGRAVVGDDHLAAHTCARECRQCLVDARVDRARLVETRDDNRNGGRGFRHAP